MILATLRTITGRRGSFRGGAAVVIVGVILVIVIQIVVHELRPGRNPSMGGQSMLDGTSGAVTLLGIIVGILTGALAGSYDVAQGTMRYLVITGARRSQVYAARVVAVALAVLLIVAVPLCLGIAASVVLPHTSSDAISAGAVVDVAWTAIVNVSVFALISMGIGSLMRSNGAAIAISLVFAIGFTPLLLLLYRVNDTLGDATLASSLGRITGSDEGMSIAASAVAVVVWVAFFLGIGAVRVQRDEY